MIFSAPCAATTPAASSSSLNRGFDPNTRDEHGQTGLLIALREPSPKVIQVLLDSPKTNVELRNAKDESPLMMAALKGQQDLVTKLIARDADINKPGWAPLHYAATNGHVAIMKQLLDNHAFIDAQSPNGTHAADDGRDVRLGRGGPVAARRRRRHADEERPGHDGHRFRSTRRKVGGSRTAVEGRTRPKTERREVVKPEVRARLFLRP